METTTRTRKSSLIADEEHVILLDPEDEHGDKVTIKPMSEGKRAQYQAMTTNDIRVEKQSGDSAFSVDQGKDRKWMGKVSIVDWDILDAGGNPIPFSPATFEQTWEKLDPAVIDNIIEGIREHNSWMADLDDIEALREELKDVQSRLDRAEEREASKNS